MKYRYCLTTTVFTIACYLYSDQTQVPSNITITVSPHMVNQTYNNPTQTTSNAINNAVEIHNKNLTLTRLNIKIPHPSIDQCTQYAQDLYTSFMQVMCQHKHTIAITSLVGIYAVLCYSVHRAHYYLQDTNHWFAWKRDYTLAQLAQIDPQELRRQLLVSIQSRYISIEHPMSFLPPIIHFIRDIEHEHAMLLWYKKFLSWLDWLYLARITWVSQEQYKHIQDKIDRLRYLKDIFDTWIAEQNLQQNICHGAEEAFSIKRLYRLCKNMLFTLTQGPKRALISLFLS